MDNKYKKLSVDFPADEYVYLKMTCAKKGVSIRDFVTRCLIRNIEEFEDELDAFAIDKITAEERKESIPFEKVKKDLGWDRL